MLLPNIQVIEYLPYSQEALALEDWFPESAMVVCVRRYTCEDETIFDKNKIYEVSDNPSHSLFLFHMTNGGRGEGDFGVCGLLLNSSPVLN